MTKRIALEDEEHPTYSLKDGPNLDPLLWLDEDAAWAHLPRDGRGDCRPCRGTGWSAFFAGGGRVCAECGGNGGRRSTSRRMELV